MNYVRGVVYPFRNYLNYSGRASRSEFWWQFLVLLIALAAFTVWQNKKFPALIMGHFGPELKFLMLLPLAHFILLPATTVRRLQDTGRSSAWLLILPGTIAGWMAALYGMSLAIPWESNPPDLPMSLVFLMLAAFVLPPILAEIILLSALLRAGTKGDNRYGREPTGSLLGGRAEGNGQPRME